MGKDHPIAWTRILGRKEGFSITENWVMKYRSLDSGFWDEQQSNRRHKMVAKKNDKLLYTHIFCALRDSAIANISLY